MAEGAGVGWLTRLLQAPARRQSAMAGAGYTPLEVKQALRHAQADTRIQRIHDCVAHLGWRLDEPVVRQRFRGLEDYHARLPRILTLYCRGWATQAIAADLSLFSTAVGVERAIDTAAAVIAEQLNHQQAA